MHWVSRSDLLTIVLTLADLASVYISALFFSEKVRRWSYRKRWGALPVINPQLGPITRARIVEVGVQQGRNLRRNPFEPQPREVGGTAPSVRRDQSGRPSFKRSTVLQQRIAQHERAAAGFGLASPDWQKDATSAILSVKGGLLNLHFEPALTISHI